MEPLTNPQAAVLDYIRREIARSGRPPTVREIGLKFGYRSTGTVRDHLAALEHKGCITREGSASRNIRLAGEFAAATGLPLVGRVAAGTPIEAIENIEGYVSLDSPFASPEELFCLRVEGESMKDADIRDRDIVVVRKKEWFDDGEIGVAVVDEEATVKRVTRTKDGVDLVPANDAFSTIHVGPGKDFRYAGQVVGVLRAMRPA